MEDTRIQFKDFYHHYYGHATQHLEIVVNHFKKQNKKFIYLVGDSSLDNKHWILDKKSKSANGYQQLIEPPYAVMDVCHNLNEVLETMESEDAGYVAVNCAVEESTVGMREKGKLIEQDQIVQKHITKDDILIVSLGGNDIALRPTFSTIMSLVWISKISSENSIKNGTAWGMEHFIKLFRNKIEDYINTLCPEDRRPDQILVCMIYFPQEKMGGWADKTLKLLNYFKNPKRLQLIISSIFENATKTIKIKGSRIIPVKLFDILNSSEESEDYVEAVEPSEIGGKKMAEAFYKLIQD